MKKLLLLSVLLTTMRMGVAQVAGGATYGARDSSPAQEERNKRQATPGELRPEATATFIEAGVLMNVPADEYVAVFGVSQEGETVAAANAKMDATIAAFKAALLGLGIRESDLFVDFVVQSRIYSYTITGDLAKEELVGFEIKKNVSVRFGDKTMLDRLTLAAAQEQIYDLVKVDYVVRDTPAIQERLQAEAGRIIKLKAERHASLLGIKLSGPVQVVADRPSIYAPLEQYVAYVASESENISVNTNRYTVQNARKGRTIFFNPLSGDGFDLVINPVIIEPVVQFTAYLKVKYEAGGKR